MSYSFSVLPYTYKLNIISFMSAPNNKSFIIFVLSSLLFIDLSTHDYFTYLCFPLDLYTHDINFSHKVVDEAINELRNSSVADLDGLSAISLSLLQQKTRFFFCFRITAYILLFTLIRLNGFRHNGVARPFHGLPSYNPCW